MLKILVAILAVSAVVLPGWAARAQETVAVTVPNIGGAMGGHTPWGFRGMGTGLFAGDNLNPGFPNGEGVHFFISFDLNGLPAGTVERAELRSDHLQVTGDPFGDLGALRAETIRYSRFSPDLWDEPTVADACVLTERVAPSVACDVTAAVTQALADGQQLAQFRLRLDQVSDNDGVADLVMFFISGSNTNETGIFTLEVTVQPARPNRRACARADSPRDRGFACPPCGRVCRQPVTIPGGFAW